MVGDTRATHRWQPLDRRLRLFFSVFFLYFILTVLLMVYFYDWLFIISCHEPPLFQVYDLGKISFFDFYKWGFLSILGIMVVAWWLSPHFPFIASPRQPTSMPSDGATPIQENS